MLVGARAVVIIENRLELAEPHAQDGLHKLCKTMQSVGMPREHRFSAIRAGDVRSSGANLRRSPS
jgi:hypothetical protein